jgi:hypothetical protein
MLCASLCRLDFVDRLPDDPAKRVMVFRGNERIGNRRIFLLPLLSRSASGSRLVPSGKYAPT